MSRFFFSTILFVIVTFISCGGQDVKEEVPFMNQAVSESLIQANKQLTNNESNEIDLYLRKNGLKMEQSGTGLRYLIEKSGSGQMAKPGMRATVKFKLSLLNGKVCYSSDSTGTAQFIIDQDEVESGLHEGIKLLREGDKAKFILPSHLAHGLAGDQDCIPAKSPVIYDIELLKLK